MRGLLAEGSDSSKEEQVWPHLDSDEVMIKALRSGWVEFMAWPLANYAILLGCLSFPHLKNGGNPYIT